MFPTKSNTQHTYNDIQSESATLPFILYSRFCAAICKFQMNRLRNNEGEKGAYKSCPHWDIERGAELQEGVTRVTTIRRNLRS